MQCAFVNFILLEIKVALLKLISSRGEMREVLLRLIDRQSETDKSGYGKPTQNVRSCRTKHLGLRNVSCPEIALH